MRGEDLISITQVVVDENAAPNDNPAWFPGARLNWAQNQLRCRSNKVAIIQASEKSQRCYGSVREVVLIGNFAQRNRPLKQVRTT